MYVHSLDAWLASRGRDLERVAIVPTTPTVNNREVSATLSRGFVRYTFVSLAGGGEVLNNHDVTSLWAEGPAITLPGAALVAERARNRIVRGASVPLAFVFPGAGQFAGDYKLKGLLFSSVGIAGAALLVKGVTGTGSAIENGQIAFDKKDLINNRAEKTRYDSGKSTLMIGAGTLGAVWAIALIDAAMHSKTTTGVEVIGRPGASPTSKSSVTNIGLKFPFGGPPR